MSSPSATQGRYPYQNDPIWSRSEKRIARIVFDAALTRELQDVMQKAKSMANKIKEPAGVWELERYLTQRRKDIDHKYEFRSSRLTQVFGMLLYERRVTKKNWAAYNRTKRRRFVLVQKCLLRMPPDPQHGAAEFPDKVVLCITNLVFCFSCALSMRSRYGFKREKNSAI